MNIQEGEPQDRHMTTGLHTVRDITCISCQTIIGWKYASSFEFNLLKFIKFK